MTWSSRAVAALAAGVLALPAPAYAQGWSSPDPEADVTGWHWDPQPEPCGTTTDLDGSAEANEDITRLGARLTRDRVVMVARFRDLDEARDQHVSFFVTTAHARWELDLDRRHTASGQVRVTTLLVRLPPDPEPDPDPDPDESGGECGWYGFMSWGVHCAVERDLDVDADTVTVALPRSCVRSPRWVRVGLRTMAFDRAGDLDTAGYSAFSDVWGIPEDDDTSLVPPLGPRLRAPARSQTGAPSHRSQVASSATGSRRSLVISRTGFPIGTTAASAN